jgi:hypothetical protein
MGYVEPPTVYRPLTQDPPSSLAVMVLTKEGPLELVEGMQEQLASIDHDLVLGDLGTMQARQSAALSQPRFRAVLFGSFAGLALLLAVVASMAFSHRWSHNALGRSLSAWLSLRVVEQC